MRLQLFGGVCVALLMLVGSAHANLLVNSGFEDPPTAPNPEYFGATGWTDFGGNTYTVDNSLLTPNSGNQALKMFGGISGVFQTFPASPGELWDGGAFVLNDTADQLSGGQVAAVNIEWLDAGLSQISFISNGETTAATTAGEWILRPVSGVAPAGTAFARLTLITGEFAGPGGGAPKYDDAFFAPRPAIPEPSTVMLAGGAILGVAVLRWRFK